METMVHIAMVAALHSSPSADHVDVDAISAIRDICALRGIGEEDMVEDREPTSDDCSEFGSTTCICPKCGKRIPHTKRGVPCNRMLCPYCGSNMRGTQCWE